VSGVTTLLEQLGRFLSPVLSTYPALEEWRKGKMKRARQRATEEWGI